MKAFSINNKELNYLKQKIIRKIVIMKFLTMNFVTQKCIEHFEKILTNWNFRFSFSFSNLGTVAKFCVHFLDKG